MRRLAKEVIKAAVILLVLVPLVPSSRASYMCWIEYASNKRNCGIPFNPSYPSCMGGVYMELRHCDCLDSGLPADYCNVAWPVHGWSTVTPVSQGGVSSVLFAAHNSGASSANWYITVVNGDDQASYRLTGMTLKLNGVTIFTPSDINSSSYVTQTTASFAPGDNTIELDNQAATSGEIELLISTFQPN